MNAVLPYLKALVAGLVAFTGAVATGYQSGDEMSQAEWWFAISTGLVALATVFGVPNKDPQGRRQQDSVQPPHDGVIDVDGRHEL